MPARLGRPSSLASLTRSQEGVHLARACIEYRRRQVTRLWTLGHLAERKRVYQINNDVVHLPHIVREIGYRHTLRQRLRARQGNDAVNRLLALSEWKLGYPPTVQRVIFQRVVHGAGGMGMGQSNNEVQRMHTPAA